MCIHKGTPTSTPEAQWATAAAAVRPGAVRRAGGQVSARTAMGHRRHGDRGRLQKHPGVGENEFGWGHINVLDKTSIIFHKVASISC